MSGNAFKIRMKCPPVVSATIPATQTISFGAKTLRGYGGHSLANTGGALTITTNPSSLFAIDSSNQIVLAGTYGAAPPALTGPYTVVVNNGTANSTVTVNIAANAYHVTWRAGTDTYAANQLDTTLNLSGVTYGDTIYVRAGITMNPAADRWDSGRSSAAGAFTGTWSGSNYVNIVGEGTLASTWIRSSISGGRSDQYISVQNLNLSYPYTGSTGSGEGAMNLINSPNFVEIRGCSLVGGGYNATDPAPGSITCGIVSGASSHDIRIVDNYFAGFDHGIAIYGYNAYVVGNEFCQIWQDSIHITNTYNCEVSWNFGYDSRYFHNGALHGDCIQLANQGFTTGTITNLGNVIGNIFIRGAPQAGYGNGALVGIYDTANTATSGLVVRGNIYTGTQLIGTSCYKITTPDISFNTLLQAPGATTVPGTLDYPTTYFREGFGGYSRYNAIAQAVNEYLPGTAVTQLNNVVLATSGAVSGACSNPTHDTTPTSRAQVVGWFGMKTGGSCDPAITGKPYWAGGDHYVDYVARTTSFPI